MNKKTSIALVSTAVFALLGGCTSLNQSVVSKPISISVEKTFTPDIEVGKKTSGTANTTVILGLIKLGDSQFADGVNYSAGGALSLGSFGIAEDTKSAAAYKAIKSAGADVLIAPTYVVTKNGIPLLFTRVKAEVTGFAGTVKSVK
jgi:hypothetical protein